MAAVAAAGSWGQCLRGGADPFGCGHPSDPAGRVPAVQDVPLWISGRVLCESPRWVLVDTSTGLHSDDVISRLKEWRVAGLISQDISYRSWHVNKEGRINLSVGLIDSCAKAEIRNVDPRFTTGTCKALLSAIGIWVDSKSISIDEAFDSEGIASNTMSVNVSKNDIDRLVSISRSFTSNNEKMKVLFTSGSFTLGGTLVTTSTSPMSNKRPMSHSHVSSKQNWRMH